MRSIRTGTAGVTGVEIESGGITREIRVAKGLVLASGGISLYFSYRENQEHLVALQREKAQAAADRIEQYILNIEQQLGWKPAETFETGIRKTVQWYLANPEWVAHVQSGAYREWVDANYSARTASNGSP